MDDVNTLIGFYGDDFSGTTAAAETLTQSGVSTVIFANPPSRSYLQRRFSLVQAVGISGTARTLPADAIKQELTPVFLAMKSYGAPIYLYKVCSTFDSSARVGSIGQAIELGLKIFAPEYVPVVAAAPKFGRYTVFGNHFAALGAGEIFRLDRHPSMSQHPATPMQEADLGRHLARQTELRSGLINILDINAGPTRINSLIDGFVAAGVPIVFFDCLTENDLNKICATILRRISKNKPLFLVGSQESGYGLAAACKAAGLLPERSKLRLPDKMGTDRGPLLVLSGSCATVNGEQIRWARKNGFVEVAIRPQNLLDDDKKISEKRKIVSRALEALVHGDSVILHTAVGPQDPRIRAMAEMAEKLSLTAAEANATLGNELGDMARNIIGHSQVKRLVIAGGDTAGRVQQSLKIEALQVSKPIGIAAPLCYVFSRQPEFNGLEIAFKGGQVGSRDYLHQAQCARTADFEEVALGRL